MNRMSLTIVVVGLLLLIGAALILSHGDEGLFGDQARSQSNVRLSCPTTVEELSELYGWGEWNIDEFNGYYRYWLERPGNQHNHFYDLADNMEMMVWAKDPASDNFLYIYTVQGPAVAEFWVNGMQDPGLRGNPELQINCKS